ncbi:MAG: alpha/beta hydrolase [Gammaproteobacteria bacterium]|nr:alpha/beta hydrolase [Gammaproteobacteria bacterium]
MYLITNREINIKKKGLDIFGKNPNTKGAQEITVVEMEKKGKAWVTKPVTDKLSVETVKELKKKYKIDIDVKADWHGSLKVACEIFEMAMEKKKSILFFVHGYNNDVKDVVKAAQDIERLYDVIVVPFTWPANGGNAISGAASYRSDKADGRQSAGALNRVVGKIQYYHSLLTRARLDNIRQRVAKKYPDDSESPAAREYFTQLQENSCQTKLSLLCHSMGNYVLKHTLLTTDSRTRRLVFDNVCLVAADTNNKNHKEWVDKLDVRNRCYVVINENDSALAASRIKPGDEQLARLGQYTKKLNSSNAYYIDVTGADDIGREHTYFKGDSVKDNAELRAIFEGMFTGKTVEDRLGYHVDKNTYRFKKLAATP